MGTVTRRTIGEKQSNAILASPAKRARACMARQRGRENAAARYAGVSTHVHTRRRRRVSTGLLRQLNRAGARTASNSLWLLFVNQHLHVRLVLVADHLRNSTRKKSHAKRLRDGSRDARDVR